MLENPQIKGQDGEFGKSEDVDVDVFCEVDFVFLRYMSEKQT